MFPIAPLYLPLLVVHSRLIRRDVYPQQEKVPEFFSSSVRCFVKSPYFRFFGLRAMKITWGYSFVKKWRAERNWLTADSRAPLPEQFSLKSVGPAPEVAARDARFSPYATANDANGNRRNGCRKSEEVAPSKEEIVLSDFAGERALLGSQLGEISGC